MTKKNGGRPPRETAPSDFDISFDQLFAVGEGDAQKYVSAKDILLHQQFKAALAGKPSGVATILKIMKINSRARKDQPPPEGEWSKVEERFGKPIIDANPALQLLGIASRYYVHRTKTALGVEPWVVAACEERGKGLGSNQSWFLSPHVLPIEAVLAGTYHLADDPRFAPPPPKLSPESTQFQLGKSGNPRGRPRREVAPVELPFEGFLNEPVTLTIEGEPFEGTRVQALIHQANLRAAKGDEKLARVLVPAYIEEQYFRWKNRHDGSAIIMRGTDEELARDPFHAFLIKMGAISKRSIRQAKIMPWLVEDALSRLGSQRLTSEEQAEVVRSTSTPEKVQWPEWWEALPAKKS